jgi:hypothetical protein
MCHFWMGERLAALVWKMGVRPLHAHDAREWPGTATEKSGEPGAGLVPVAALGIVWFA